MVRRSFPTAPAIPGLPSSARYIVLNVCQFGICRNRFQGVLPSVGRDVVSVWVSDQYIFVQKTFSNSPDRFRAMALSNGFA